MTLGTLNGSILERFQPSFILKVDEPVLHFDILIRYDNVSFLYASVLPNTE